MTNGNYLRFFRLIGKLTFNYDNAAAAVTTQQTTQYRAMEQACVSAQEFADLPEIGIVAQYYAQWTNAISSGPTAMQALMIAIATKILTNADFTAALTTVPTNSTIGAVLTALATEMSAAHDNVTFSTQTTSGIVNFLNQCGLPTTFTWHTITDASATYKDSVLSVQTIV